MEENKKKPWMSKTILANLAMALLALFGQADLLSPEKMMSLMAGVNIVLRFVTKDKISLEE